MLGFEVAVIGGGAAGMSAALTLARARRCVVVFDDGAPRNGPAPRVHGFLSRDGITPADLREAARAQAVAYGVEVHAGRVAQITGDVGSGFAVEVGGEVVRAGRVVLALGVHDVLPRLPGFEGLWGRSIIHCPYCHGWEVSGGRWGVVAYDQPGVAGKVDIFASWADDLVLFADDRTGADAIDHCRRRGVPVEWRRITGLRTRDDALDGVEVEGGGAITLPTLLWPLRQRLPDLVLGLGLALDSDGHVAVDEGRRTSRTGVYAAGDVASFRRQQVVHAAAAGVTAASSVVADIAAERWVLSPV